MFSVERKGHKAYFPVVGNIQNAALYLLEVYYPWVFSLVKPHEVILLGVEGGCDYIDIIVPEANGGLVGVDPSAGRKGIADVVEIILSEGAF